MHNPDEQPPVLTRQHGPVLELILNQGKQHNSLTLAFTRTLLEALRAAASDTHCRAILISARGKSFSAGGDIREMLAHEDRLTEYVDEAMQYAHNPLIDAIDQCPKPVITALQGPAIGAGAGLALAADFTLASQEASLQLPFVPALGIVPDAGCSWQLAQSLGYRRALGHVLTGTPLSATQACDAGLVWACVDGQTLHEEALRMARQLSALPSTAVERCRRLLREANRNTLQQQLALEHELQLESFAGPAVREGLAAIREKRKPDFNGCE